MTPSSVARFSAGYPFEFDPYQVKALEALAGGDSVLVAAPTGSGKTVVGEFAVWLALDEGRKAFYTTPLKALSNQKFGDFVALHGAGNAGLLTGDNSINPLAPVVVMTTEVLRNMIYERSEVLTGLGYVILDEVHYLQDPYRGAVWEEVIIHLPLDVKIVSLSATVSNAEEFAGWIETIRGTTTAVTEEHRPVELEHHYVVSDGRMMPMFATGREGVVPNPQVMKMGAGWEGSRGKRRHRSRYREPRRSQRGPHRTDVIGLLEDRNMLPAIYFIFSRKGCDAAVRKCLRERTGLTNGEERSRIREYAEMRCSYLGDEDLEVLGYGEWIEALGAGIASHHAGLIPVFKETVEELFQAGLVKVVFATETLSLGINMPARTVVIESVIKFTGERHELMTPGQFTQLTGRAGRRGIDTLGHAVVLERSGVTFLQIAGLASAASHPLVSSFQPSYNMATNLVRNYSREEAEHLLNSSFAQYRADKEVVVLERLIERNDAYLASYREKMAHDQGQWAKRASKLERETGRLRKRMRSRAETLSHRFGLLLEILGEFGYVKDFSLTEKGWALARIYNENDLIVAEAATAGWLGGLDPGELAAVVSTFVFESRGPFEMSGTLPSQASRRVYSRIVRLAERLRAREKQAHLELTRGTETGFVEPVYRWCRGAALEEVLGEDLTAGDFIRSCKQTIDLLRQLQQARLDPTLHEALGRAIEGANRGVVAYTGAV